MKPAATARTCTDIAGETLARVLRLGGPIGLFLSPEGRPCFAPKPSPLFTTLEAMNSLSLVGVFDCRARLPDIASDIADTLA